MPNIPTFPSPSIGQGGQLITSIQTISSHPCRVTDRDLESLRRREVPPAKTIRITEAARSAAGKKCDYRGGAKRRRQKIRIVEAARSAAGEKITKSAKSVPPLLGSQ
jgi:hypothetical protein